MFKRKRKTKFSLKEKNETISVNKLQTDGTTNLGKRRAPGYGPVRVSLPRKGVELGIFCFKQKPGSKPVDGGHTCEERGESGEEGWLKEWAEGTYRITLLRFCGKKNGKSQRP